MEENKLLDSTQNCFEYAQNRINDFLQEKGFELKIKTRYWVKKREDGSYLTIQFHISKRRTNFALDYGLFLPSNTKKAPKPQQEQIWWNIGEFIQSR